MDRNPARTHFVTGATGFVGAALLIELLRVNPRDRALCLVRGADADHARRRVEDALAQAADAYGVSREDLASACDRVVAVRGDMTQPGLGLSDRDRCLMQAAGPLHVWHSAASLKDTEEALSEVVAHNVTGVERLLKLVLQFDITVFNHVSTAYVAGRSPVARETLARPRGFSNRYEQTKHYGECLVHDYCSAARVPYRILRPAIVVGHSVTGRATGYTGFLGWALKLAALNEASGGALARQKLTYVAKPDAELNVIPINSVVEDCLGIDAAGSTTHNRVFHLTNTAAPTIEQLSRAACRALGLAGFEFAPTADGLDLLSKRFYRWTRFERPYTMSHKQFSRHDSNGLYASSRHGYCPLDEDTLERMMRLAVVDYQQQQRAAKEGAA